MLFKKVVKLVLIICLIVIAHLYWTKSVFATSAIEQQINILDQIFYTTSTTDNPTDNSLGLVRWTSGSYTGATVYFEADIKITSLGKVTATLYDSAGNAVSGGTATCTNCTSDLTRSRSSAITLTDGTDYTVRLKTTAGAGLLNSARLIVVQSDATKLITAWTPICGINQSLPIEMGSLVVCKSSHKFDFLQNILKVILFFHLKFNAK